MGIATTDSRGRVSLGTKDQIYKVTEFDDGALLLEPAVLMTRADLAFATDAALQRTVAESLADPEQGVVYRRRSPRRDRA